LLNTTLIGGTHPSHPKTNGQHTSLTGIMPLLALWQSNPEAVTAFTVEQLVATAGDGKLRDSSECSNELRTYLAQVGSDKLAQYAEHCLAESFTKSGMVLQDVVNELGRRLEYNVLNGRIKGHLMRSAMTACGRVRKGTRSS
jgi:hypothetical protein